MDHFHHLYCLQWLNDSNFYRTQEAETGLGKSTLRGDSSCSQGYYRWLGG